jgi:aspartate/methionine/tyrosine aminotransferase
MDYKRMPIEIESPEQYGYENIKCNLAESSVSDAVLKDIKLDLNNLVLCYGDHLGKPELRELIAKEYNMQADEILLTVAAASALFIISTSLLNNKNHLVVVRPNYATNIETPRAIGCAIDYLDLKFEEKFSINFEELEKLIKPETRYISFTHPHNPTGTTLDLKEIYKLIELVERKNIILLLDETYRDLSFDEPYPLAASLSDHVISVSSVSKAYGLPGIRMGWIACKNKNLMEKFLAAKEQIFICNSVVDEEIAYQYLLQKEKHFASIKKHIESNFSIVKNWIKNEPRFEWVEPTGGVICFPRIKSDLKVNVEKFYKILFEKYKTCVGPGHWFEMDKHHMRIGFGWPDTAQLTEGLKNISLAVDESYL